MNNDRESRRVLEHSVVAYVTPQCGFCARALTLLLRHGVMAQVVDVSDKPAVRAWLREVSGARTVPQIFIRGEVVGGYTELLGLEVSGVLASRLATIAVPSLRPAVGQ